MEFFRPLLPSDATEEKRAVAALLRSLSERTEGV